MKDGALVATVLVKPSAGGKELTVTTLTPGHPDQLAVWTAPVARRSRTIPSPASRPKTLGKSRMRQGMTLKIDADGSGGVHFSGDYSYDAHFDGKPYELKNSRNDTVKLQLVDPHTVSAVYYARQPGHAEGQVGRLLGWATTHRHN